MADEQGQSQPITVAKAVVPVEADTTSFERTMDEVEDRIDGVAAKAAKILDPLFARFQEFGDKMEEAREDALHTLLDPAGPTEPGRDGGEVTPLGPNAALTEMQRLTISIEDTNTLLRQTNDLLQQLIASQQQ